MRRFGLFLSALLFVLLAGCQSILPKTVAQSGDLVRVEYTLTLADGTIADSSEGRDPLEFTLGAGEVVPGFDSGVSGLHVGESAEFTVPAAEGYGDRQSELILTLPLNEDEVEVPEVDSTVYLNGPGGIPIPAKVLEIADESITLDANHPLAGQDLTFAVELVEIVSDANTGNAEAGTDLEP
ncbi:peptidylprolyl isomerase [Synechococcus sp. PCC 7336]|uniref:FKBP-type peptidyl-prolyl cis-trans isomerase n=1 Tax=Synechococcus sp. PCC 7336 TaxID=195250 RepID=UPI00034CDBA9|nr:peptidylprolyl isomerase [Synechococcus sp. PCC 7336]